MINFSTKDLVFKTEISDDEIIRLHQNVFCHEQCARYMLWKANSDISYTIERLKKWHNEIYKFYYVCELETGEPIGFLTFLENEHIIKDIGLCVGKDYFRKGYGKQILKSLISYSLSKGVQEIEYSAFHENEASIELAKSLGFSFSHDKKSIRKHDNLEFIEDVFTLKL